MDYDHETLLSQKRSQQGLRWESGYGVLTWFECPPEGQATKDGRNMEAYFTKLLLYGSEWLAFRGDWTLAHGNFAVDADQMNTALTVSLCRRL